VPVQQAEQAKPAESSAFRLYTANEVSGDMTIIDSADYHVIATVPLAEADDRRSSL
jgi:YVTN family beta-propeller protein